MELPRPEIKTEIIVQDFFEQKFTAFVFKGRYFIIILFLGCFCVCSIWSSQIGKLTLNERLVSKDHPEYYPFRVFEERLIKEEEVD